MKRIKSIIQTTLILIAIYSTCLTQAQVPDPELGLRAEWMRGTYGLNWKPAKSANGRSELESLTIKPFLEQISGLRTVDYIQLHLGESFIYSPVHLGPHELLESLWQGDKDENGNPINLVVPRASIGRDPFMDLIDDVRAAGMKVQVYVNTGNMLRFWRGYPKGRRMSPPDDLPDVTERWINWCDTNPEAQSFINSQSYHTHPDFPERQYIFCYAEFVLKEYAIRYGEKIDAWLFDNAKVWRFWNGDSLAAELDYQRIFQSWADACHAGNPDAALAFSNGPGSGNLVDNPFSNATLFCDYMFGHPFAAGKNLGDHPANKFSLTWMADRDGYVHTNDPNQSRTWDDKVVGHFDPPMSTSAWNKGVNPALTNEQFLEWYSLGILGGGAMTPGIPLLDRDGWESLIMEDWAMEQISLLDSFLIKNQVPGSPNWARQETILPDAYLGKDYYFALIEDRDFWDPEGDAIISLKVVAGDAHPSWLSIGESGSQPGTWILSGTPGETEAADYSFRIRVEDASGGTDREVTLKVLNQ